MTLALRARCSHIQLRNEQRLSHYDSVGYKALARATSDLAAMGATPRFFLLTLALPPSRTGKWFDGFLAGMARAAREYNLLLAGGDTSSHPTIAISISVIGEVPAGAAVTRTGG